MSDRTRPDLFAGPWGSTVVFCISAATGMLLGGHVILIGLIALGAVWASELGQRVRVARRSSSH